MKFILSRSSVQKYVITFFLFFCNPGSMKNVGFFSEFIYTFFLVLSHSLYIIFIHHLVSSRWLVKKKNVIQFFLKVNNKVKEAEQERSTRSKIRKKICSYINLLQCNNWQWNSDKNVSFFFFFNLDKNYLSYFILFCKNGYTYIRYSFAHI